jgi:hypothetical protein
MTSSRLATTSDMSTGTSIRCVLDAVQELHAQEQVVTREALAKVLDLPPVVIDDRIGTLINAGLVNRVRRGIYEPAERHAAPRVISKTLLPCGTVKIDIGDDVWTLTPKEDRMLAAIQAGVVLQTASIEAGHHSALIAADLSLQVKTLRRELNALKRSGAKASAQMELMP